MTVKVTGLPAITSWLTGGLVIRGGPCAPTPMVYSALPLDTTAAKTRSGRTCTGLLRDVVLPFPNSPVALNPVAHTVPLLFTYRVCALPAVTATTSLATTTGLCRSVEVPLPNWP